MDTSTYPLQDMDSIEEDNSIDALLENGRLPEGPESGPFNESDLEEANEGLPLEESPITHPDPHHDEPMTERRVRESATQRARRIRAEVAESTNEADLGGQAAL